MHSRLVVRARIWIVPQRQRQHRVKRADCTMLLLCVRAYLAVCIFVVIGIGITCGRANNQFVATVAGNYRVTCAERGSALLQLSSVRPSVRV